MSDSFNCDLSDSLFTRKHLKSKQHKYLSSRIFYRCFITNPELHQLKVILIKFIFEHEKKLNFIFLCVS